MEGTKRTIIEVLLNCVYDHPLWERKIAKIWCDNLMGKANKQFVKIALHTHSHT